MVESRQTMRARTHGGKRSISQLPSGSQVSTHKLQVCVRIKPGKDKEEQKVENSWQSGTIKIAGGPNGTRNFGPFSCVIGPTEGQHPTFSQLIQPLYDAFMQGYNCTVFAYGQTGSGKTHTLIGPPKFHLGSDEEWGFCPKVMKMAYQVAAASGGAITLNVQAVEIYFNDCYDLLNNKVRVVIQGFGRSIQVGGAINSFNSRMNAQRDAKGKWIPPAQDGTANVKKEYEMSGTKDIEIRDQSDITNIMQTIEATRTAKSHNLNDRSSRSHCVITLKLRQTTGGKIVNSKFIFADLAGSERIYKSGVINALDLRAEEAKNINTSLSALGRIVAMMNQKSTGYMPFRDSALTMLLKESFTGNTKTALVVAVAGQQSMISETMSSLKFGLNCGNVKTKVSRKAVNVTDSISQQEAALAQCVQELKRMEGLGWKGGFEKDAPKPTCDQFRYNYRNLVAEQEAMKKLQGKLVRTAKGEDVSALMAKKEAHAKSIEVIRGMLARQITTKIWIQPKQVYLDELQKHASLAAELEKLTGNPVPKYQTDVIPITFEMIWNDLKLSECI